MKYAFCVILVLSALNPLWGIMLKGANGREVDFAGVLKASKEGLTVKISPDANEMVVPWEKFDLDAMKAEQPEIYTAYTRSSLGQNEVMLKLGVFENHKTYDEIMVSMRKSLDERFAVPLPSSYDHWFENYYSRSRNSFDAWQRAQRRYHTMINDLFAGAPIVRNQTGKPIGRSYYYYSAYYYGSTWDFSAEVTSKRVLNYFAGDHDSFHDTLDYLQNNPLLVIGVAEKLQAAKQEFANSGHSHVQTQHGTIDFVLDSSIRTLETMAEGRAYNENSGRVLNKLLTVTYKEDAKGI
ncbi:hypothetical protein [Cerasicoccus fimbriatus]|uniref:hypothetical protein n=1 Tax=Cerasicoccus fimbriatus TaxID=3014554 RepID=UPI0022B32E47|nr:hypothetical protein [Cerasicoccus sp. TK19100]